MSIRVARRRRTHLAGFLAGAALVLGVGMAQPASATSPQLLVDVAGDPGGWASAPTVALFAGSVFGPGQSASASLGLRNASSDPGVLDLRIIDVSGDLAPQLNFTVTVLGSDPGAWAGSIADLEKGVVVDGSMTSGQTVRATLTAGLPPALGNQWSLKGASFDLLWTLTDPALSPGAATRSSSVAVTGSGRVSPPHSGGGLAFTGSDVWLPLGCAALFLASGLLLVGAERRRKAH